MRLSVEDMGNTYNGFLAEQKFHFVHAMPLLFSCRGFLRPQLVLCWTVICGNEALCNE